MEGMRSVGLADVQVFGVEGPAWSLLKAVEQQSEAGPSGDMFVSLLTAAWLAEPSPELLAASSRLLAVGGACEDRTAR